MSELGLLINASDNAVKVGFGPAKRTRDHIPGDLYELTMPSIYCDDCYPSIKRLFSMAQGKVYDFVHITVENDEFNQMAEGPLLEFLENAATGMGNPQLRLSLPVDILEQLLERASRESE